MSGRAVAVSSRSAISTGARKEHDHVFSRAGVRTCTFYLYLSLLIFSLLLYLVGRLHSPTSRADHVIASCTRCSTSSISTLNAVTSPNAKRLSLSSGYSSGVIESYLATLSGGLQRRDPDAQQPLPPPSSRDRRAGFLIRPSPRSTGAPGSRALARTVPRSLAIAADRVGVYSSHRASRTCATQFPTQILFCRRRAACVSIGVRASYERFVRGAGDQRSARGPPFPAASISRLRSPARDRNRRLAI